MNTIQLNILMSIIAGTILGILSNWLYDLLEGKILPEKPTVKRFVIIVVVFVPFVILVALPELTATDPVQIEYTGYVFDSETRDPIRGAEVIIVFQDTVFVVDTDSGGLYRFDGLYRFTVSIDSGLSGHGHLMVVESDSYENYDRYITISPENRIVEDVLLKRMDIATSPTQTPEEGSQVAAPTPSLSEDTNPIRLISPEDNAIFVGQERTSVIFRWQWLSDTEAPIRFTVHMKGADDANWFVLKGNATSAQGSWNFREATGAYYWKVTAQTGSDVYTSEERPIAFSSE